MGGKPVSSESGRGGNGRAAGTRAGSRRISGKEKFVSEKTYDDGTQTTLFRYANNKSLQILWNDKGWPEIALPLAAEGEITVTLIDGTIHTLHPGENTTTLSVGLDLLLLAYTSSDPLPETLGTPAATWSDLPEGISAKNESQLPVTTISGSAPNTIAPPGWTVSTGKPGFLTITPPSSTAAREIPFTLTLGLENKPTGLLHRRLPISR